MSEKLCQEPFYYRAKSDSMRLWAERGEWMWATTRPSGEMVPPHKEHQAVECNSESFRSR